MWGWLFCAGALAFFNINILLECSVWANIVPATISGIVMLFMRWE
jgi:hypothetical protein